MSDNELDDILDGVQADVDAEGGEDEEFIFDFSEAGAGVDFKVGAPHGKRLTTIKSVKSGTSKKGNPTIVFCFQVIAGAWKGKQFYLHAPASGAMSIKGKQVLEAVGLDAGSEDEPIAPFRRADVVGAQVVLETRPQKGKPQYDEIEAIFSADEETFEPDPNE